MFKHIGETIKAFSEIFCWIGWGVCAIAAIIYLKEQMWIMFCAAFASALGVWITAMFAYGFGELVDNSTNIAKVLGANFDDDDDLFKYDSIKNVFDD